MKIWDRMTFGIGALGFVVLTLGVALVSVPAALITAGGLLLLWSYLAARSAATLPSAMPRPSFRRRHR